MTWPTPGANRPVPQTIEVSGTFDGKLERFSGTGALGGGDQNEGQDPLFELADGAVLKNVVLGAPAADGIHCNGSCTLENVWWEDVGEDAATLRGSSTSQRMTIRCGGARGAADKVFQHNGAGTISIQNFQVEDFGKLYRSCGNCSTQYARHVEIRDVTARGGDALAGINSNYGDTARFSNVTIHDAERETAICDRYTGNDEGDEPTKTGTGPDAMHCLYDEARDIRWVQ